MLYAIKSCGSDSYLASVPSRTGSEWVPSPEFARKFSTMADLELYVEARKLKGVKAVAVDEAKLAEATRLRAQELEDLQHGHSALNGAAS